MSTKKFYKEKEMSVYNLKGDLITVNFQDYNLIDKWLVVNFKYHLRLITMCINSQQPLNINNYIQEYCSQKMSKLRPIPQDYLDNCLNRLNQYIDLNQEKYFILLAIISIHEDYFKGYKHRLYEKYFEKTIDFS